MIVQSPDRSQSLIFVIDMYVARKNIKAALAEIKRPDISYRIMSRSEYTKKGLEASR